MGGEARLGPGGPVSVPFVRLVQEIFTLLKPAATGFSCHLHPQEFWLQHPNQRIIFSHLLQQPGPHLKQTLPPIQLPNPEPTAPSTSLPSVTKERFPLVSRQPRAGGPPPGRQAAA